MADNILDQLKAFADAQESAKRTVDELVRERNLVKEISSLTKRMSLEFNETTKNIGKSVNELELGVELQEKLNNSLRDRSTIERTLFSQLAAQKSYQKQISELQRIQSLSTTDFTNEYNNRLNQLRNELFLGKLNTQSYDEKVRILDDMYLNTDKQLFIQKKLSKENSNGIVSSRTLLDSENRRLDKLKIQNGLMQIGKKALGSVGRVCRVASGQAKPGRTGSGPASVNATINGRGLPHEDVSLRPSMKLHLLIQMYQPASGPARCLSLQVGNRRLRKPFRDGAVQPRLQTVESLARLPDPARRSGAKHLLHRAVPRSPPRSVAVHDE